MVGVVGRSGSGKTTLVNLLARFYDVDAGRVTLDGHDVRALAREDLRREIGVVLQEPFLFRGTIWDNLVYGRPKASVEDALASSHGANAHDFIMRPAARLRHAAWRARRRTLRRRAPTAVDRANAAVQPGRFDPR